MGCGSSSAPTKKYVPDSTPPVKEDSKGADAPPPATMAEPAEKVEASKGADAAKPAATARTSTGERRPSLSREVEELAQSHEGHELVKELGESTKARPSVVQTKMEIWWMDDIPKLYSVADSDELRNELQEDAQAEMVQKCVASTAEQVPALLKEWMHDCPDADGLEKFIAKVVTEITSMDRKVRFSTFETDAVERGIQRKGTGFVSAGQVKSLMAQDFPSSSEDESDEDQDDTAFEHALSTRLDRGPIQRIAVASETTATPTDWVPPVYEKSAAQRARIAEAVSDSFMFQALSYDQLQPLLDAFQEIKVEPGEKVIEEDAQVGPGDRGLFVFETGEMDVYKKGVEGAVFTYTETGQSFGELALLYNAPRSATVIATKPSILWCIDRMTFNCLVKDAIRKAKERRLAFLKSVELLKQLTFDEVATLGDALREKTYGSGVHIIQEGTEGDVFFILEKGSAAAIREGKQVMKYKPSDYFGELALLSDAPRAADVITQEDCTVLSLDRNAFQRLLGPLDSIMKDRAAQYGVEKPEEAAAS